MSSACVECGTFCCTGTPGQFAGTHPVSADGKDHGGRELDHVHRLYEHRLGLWADPDRRYYPWRFSAPAQAICIFTDCLNVGFSRLLSLVWVVIISSLSIGLHSLLMIVPGIMCATAFWIVAPICVIEHRSGMDCLERSEALTDGYRWQIFGVLLIVYVANLAWSLCLSIAYGSPGVPLTSTVVPLSHSTIDFGGSAILSAFSSVMATVGYFHLRQIKDGVDIDEIAAIFD